MRKKWIAIGLIMLMSVNLLTGLAADSSCELSIVLEEDWEVGAGQEFTVNITCSDHTVKTFDLQLEFDPTYIKVAKIPTTPDEDGLTAINTYDNEKGTIRLMHSLVNGSIGRNDIIASVTFEALETGETSIVIGEGTKLLRRATAQESPDAAYVPEHLDLSIYTIEAIRPDTPYVYSPTGSNRNFYGSMSLIIRTKTEGAEIYYTTDGSDPVIDAETTKLLNGTLTLNKTTTINAVAYKNGLYSDQLSVKFTRMTEPQNPGGGGGGGGGTPSYTATPAPSLTPTPTPTPSPSQGPSFNDVAGHWAEESIYKLANAKVLNGYEDGTFQPDAYITRAEAAKIIIGAAGLQTSEGPLPFADQGEVPDWAAGYVKTAYDQGIITGYEDGTFQPNRQLSREEMVVILVRALGLGDGDTALLDGFADRDSIQSWAAPSLAKAVELRLVGGYEDGTIRPGDNITRAEVAKIIAGCMDQ